MKPKSTVAGVRSAFFSGLALLAPFAVTWMVFAWLIERVGGGFRETFFFFVPDALRTHPALGLVWDVCATLIVVGLVTGLGYLSRYVAVHYFGRLGERVVNRIPGVGLVYGSVKHIVETITTQKRTFVESVVLVEFPRPGVYSIGFLTNQAQGEVQAKTAEVVLTVFVPTTPNPTTGFLVLIPREQVTFLEMSVGDAIKLVISGGAVTPTWHGGPENQTSPGAS